MLKAIFNWFRQPDPKAFAPAVQPEAVPYKVEPAPQVAPTFAPAVEVAPVAEPTLAPTPVAKKPAAKAPAKKPAAITAAKKPAGKGRKPATRKPT